MSEGIPLSRMVIDCTASIGKHRNGGKENENSAAYCYDKVSLADFLGRCVDGQHTSDYTRENEECQVSNDPTSNNHYPEFHSHVPGEEVSFFL